MDNELKEAFYEVDEVLKTIPQKLLNRIPKSFRDSIKENKSTTYKREIKGLEDIKNLKKETRVILYHIYRDFLCSDEECQKMKQEEIKITSDKYSYEKLFSKKENNIITEETNNENEMQMLIEYKEQKWYNRIMDFCKKIIKKAK